MEFSELVHKRQSDRKYAPEPVAREHILKCLEAARLAPSACNSQPWKFIVVDDKAKLAELARPIHISSITVGKVALPDCDFTLECSKGTYVRSLCHDIGAKLGCGGTLAALRRLRSGNFDIKDAVTIDQLKELDVDGFKALLAEKLSTFAGFGGR